MTQSGRLFAYLFSGRKNWKLVCFYVVVIETLSTLAKIIWSQQKRRITTAQTMQPFAASPFGLFCFIIIFVVANTKGSFQTGSVYCNGRSCTFVPDVVDVEKASAAGTFNDSLLTTGWGILDITAGHATDQAQDDSDIMFAAGYLEGVLTARQMEDQYTNLFAIFFPKPVNESLKQSLDLWFQKQRSWADYMVKSNPTDPLWRHAGYIFAQLDGLLAGYKSTKGKNESSLDLFAVNLLNANGDLFDLLAVINPSSIKDWTKFTSLEAQNYFYISGFCSALIKVLPGYENIFMSHSSWFAYSATNRIYKHYNLNVSDPATAAKRISFSSYPGYLESLDDFYHLGSGMVMLQTTNNIFDSSLYKYVTTQSLLAWQRVRVANMMAHNGKEWAEIVSRYNSGTYNNQYMVIDLKLIKLGSPLPDNTLWVAEQIPGLVVAEDLTPILRAGYFASYNIPFFEEIFNKSGYPAYVEKFGNDYTYELAPRAKIFRRDQSSVKNLDTFKALMRSNDYKNDPYSGGSPWGAICSRGDLVDFQPRPSGCYDAKVSDYNMARGFQAEIISGPTLGTGLEPFSWSDKFSSTSHVGLPQTYNFSFIPTQPRF